MVSGHITTSFALHWSTGQRNSWSHPFVWTLLASPRYLRTHSQMLRSRHLLQLPLETQTALQDCLLWSSCPRLLSSPHLIFLVPNVDPCFEPWPATFFTVEDQPRTKLHHIPESPPFLAPPDAQSDTPFVTATASQSCVRHSTQHGYLFNCASDLTNTSFETSTMSEL